MRRTLMAAAVAAMTLGATAAQALTLRSPDIKPGTRIADEQVFSGFGCTGKNISPALSWARAPKGTKSFALMVYDPDAPTGSGWWHWVMFNIPASATGLVKGAGDPKAGTAPQGAIQSRTDFGTPGYGGPCPPKGDKPHHYRFMLFALNVEKIDADQNASPALIGFSIHSHTLAKATLTGLWGH
jgi:Raf kinase inhibitor-like YbhB/YbcL family protein